ncbi:hypothetical protein [Nocardioides sp. GXQ0305]|uniref:hypothetical protein n=1 Tax=Nocardioides sp. GXQ0305 TaxID=3423912 RepID=UPI003D7CA555
MSYTRAADGTLEVPPDEPRVRHLAREALGLMAFSALASTTLAGCLLLLTTLGHQG